MRICNTCKASKDAAYFNKDCRSRDGLSNRCKSCASIANALRYQQKSTEIKSAVAAYTRAHAAKISEYKRKHYQTNREALASVSAAYYRQNADAVKARTKAWQQKNPDRYAVNQRAVQATRRARERQAEGRHSASDIERLLNLQRWKCAVCKTSLRAGYHVDHIQALAIGGTNWPSNLQCLCPSCNQSKGFKDPIRFAQEIGRLI